MAMTLTMIFNSVTTSHDFPAHIGIAFSPRTNDKKSSLDTITRKQFKYLWRHNRIGAVINRQRNFIARSGCCGQLRPVRTDPVATRR